MFKKSALCSLIISLAVVSPAFAQDAETQKFYDTELLITTLTADDQAALDAATKAKNDAQTLVDNAAPEDLATAQAALDEADEALAVVQLEIEDTRSLVEEGLLSEVVRRGRRWRFSSCL